MEHKRRSLDEAFATPEEEAFLHTGTALADEAVSESRVSLESTPDNSILKNASSPANPVYSGKKAGSRGALTTRLDQELLDALLHTSLDRKMRGIEPFAQSDIVAQALTEWFAKYR